MTWLQRFRLNLAYVWRYATTWVAFISYCATGYWMSRPPLDQAETIAQYPALAIIVPVVGFVAFMFAKGFPQPVTAKKVEDARVDAALTAANAPPS